MLDAVEAAIVRKKRKAYKMNIKARAQAKKMNAVDVALQTTLAETRSALDGEIVSFGNSKIALQTFLQGQYKSRTLIRKSMHITIPDASEFCMNPHPTPGKNITADMQINYLKHLPYLMIDEDLQHPMAPTVRRLPVISEAYLNP
jgi:hypothetical protein